ncbi:pectin lyase fold/virulence factor [Trichophaea hybrida]|nr:pectin lyase fold/virulence factor [Trichophaea hybrida]
MHIHLRYNDATQSKLIYQAPVVHTRPLPSIDSAGQFTLLINNTPVPTISNIDYDYAFFSLPPGRFTIRISHPNTALTSARITPLKLKIQPTISAGVVTATLPGAGYYIIKLNSFTELVLLADNPEMLIPPPNGYNIFNVLTYGAHNDNTSLAATTAAFQSCLDAASKVSGTVYVPAGIYALGNITINSNTSLYLSSNSTLRFDPSHAYTIHWRKISQGHRPITYWISTVFNSTNIRIFGRGTIDGNGVASARSNFGNNLLVPISTTSFTCSGILFKNSASWAVTPVLCTNAIFTDLKLINRFRDSGENDGIDVMHSSHVLISNAIGIGLDDPFSTKTWNAGPKDITTSWPIPTSGLPGLYNVTFENTVSWTICFGLKIGAGVFTPQEDITFRHCVVYNTSIAIGIHFAHGTKWVKNVLFEDVDVEMCTWTNMAMRTWCAFFVTGGTDTDVKGETAICRVVVKNVRVRDVGKTVAKIQGRDEGAGLVKGVLFDSVLLPTGRKAKTLSEMGFDGGVKCAEDVVVV